jgi:hypothetical protein
VSAHKDLLYNSVIVARAMGCRAAEYDRAKICGLVPYANQGAFRHVAIVARRSASPPSATSPMLWLVEPGDGDRRWHLRRCSLRPPPDRTSYAEKAARPQAREYHKLRDVPAAQGRRRIDLI